MELGHPATLPLEVLHTHTSADAWSCVCWEGEGRRGGRTVPRTPRRAGLEKEVASLSREEKGAAVTSGHNSAHSDAT